MSNLLEKASIVTTPTAYENSKILSVKPTNGIGDFDFTRNSSATRVNSQGLIVDVTSNLPRIDYTGGLGHWLFEPQSTNLFLNSDTLSTQSVSTNVESYTVSFYGTGSITFSGTHSSTLNGTGVHNRVSLTFTASSGLLTSTVSGSVIKAQFESSSFATSYIPTSGSTETRLQDAAFDSGSTDLINSTEGVLYAEIAALSDDLSFRVLSLSDGTNNNTVKFGYRSDSNKIYSEFRTASSSQSFMSFDVSDITEFNKVAFKYKENDFALWVNGVKRATDTSGVVPNTGTFNSLSFNRGDVNNVFFGKTKCVAVFKEALTDEELTCLTTI